MTIASGDGVGAHQYTTATADSDVDGGGAAVLLRLEDVVHQAHLVTVKVMTCSAAAPVG